MGFEATRLLPVSGLGGAAEIAGVGELLADLLEVPLSLRQSDVLQHAVQVRPGPAGLSLAVQLKCFSAVLALLYSL